MFLCFNFYLIIYIFLISRLWLLNWRYLLLAWWYFQICTFAIRFHLNISLRKIGLIFTILFYRFILILSNLLLQTLIWWYWIWLSDWSNELCFQRKLRIFNLGWIFKTIIWVISLIIVRPCHIFKGSCLKSCLWWRSLLITVIFLFFSYILICYVFLHLFVYLLRSKFTLWVNSFRKIFRWKLIVISLTFLLKLIFIFWIQIFNFFIILVWHLAWLLRLRLIILLFFILIIFFLIWN